MKKRLSMLVIGLILIGMLAGMISLSQNNSITKSLIINSNISNQSDWIHNARITPPYGYDGSWEEGIERAVNNNANVILDWAGFSDTYQGRVLQVNQSLETLRQDVRYVHSHYPDVKYMIYIAPLEMVTIGSDMNKDGVDDDGKDSAYTDHPDWLQVGIDGRKAVFYGSMPGMPFWVGETEEDVWLSPSNKEYRTFIMNLAKEIALTGVDAVWFDVPHLSFDFGNGWQNQWSSVDEASRNAFYNDTGLTLPAPLFQPDWNDEVWQQFVAWRYKQIHDFVRDFNQALKAGNPDCKLVIETSSNSVSITQHGCSVIDLPYACDVIAHEYGRTMEEWQYYSWLHMLASLKFWHDFDVNASWLLSYVEKGLTDLARFHAALVLTMGYNYYTSGGEGMAEIVDEQFMHDFFGWLSSHDDYFYGWNTDADLALLFSRQTLDYLDRGSWSGYAYHDEFLGTVMMLIESSIPFEIISEGDKDDLQKYDTVVLSDVACMSAELADAIAGYVQNGGTIIAINETSLYDEWGIKRGDFLLKDVFGVNYDDIEYDETYENDYGKGKSIFTQSALGRGYMWAAAPWAEHGNRIEAEYWRDEFLQLIGRANIFMPFKIGRDVIAISHSKENETMLRLLNFKGIRQGNAVPQVQEMEVEIYDYLEDLEILDYMGGFRGAEIHKGENKTVISFDLNTQCCMIYTLNGSNLYASIVRPESGKIYFNNREIMSIIPDLAIIIGEINIEANAHDEDGIDRVEFYIDDELKVSVSNPPYKFEWVRDRNKLFGHRHIIKVVAFDNIGNRNSDEIIVWKFF